MFRKLSGFVCQESNDLIVSYIQLCYLGAAEENLDSDKMIKDVLLSAVQEHFPSSAGSQLQPGGVDRFPLSTSLLAQSDFIRPTGVSPPWCPQC